MNPLLKRCCTWIPWKPVTVATLSLINFLFFIWFSNDAEPHHLVVPLDWKVTPQFNAASLVREPNLTSGEIRRILNLISSVNDLQQIFNWERFGPLTSNSSVIIIQVHFRLEYLVLLIQSLSRVKGIEDSLLIFSHDVYSLEMNSLIKQIHFARVLQIFLPFTSQLTPEFFPSVPSGEGHNKVVSYSLAKQHWWWKAHFAFDRLRVLRNHDGVIHFLEEDFYAVPDWLSVMTKLEKMMRDNVCLGCHVLHAGPLLEGELIEKTWKNNEILNKIIVTDFHDPTCNRGLAFNRTVWKRIQQCANVFCETYNEQSWDYSLMEVSFKCLPSRLSVLNPQAARILHTGDCGMHFHAKQCNPIQKVNIIKGFVQKYRRFLFPGNFNMSYLATKGTPRAGGGSWTKSDANLCYKLGHL